MEKFRSRKLLLTLLVVTLASMFLTVGKLVGSEWVTICIFALGMYKFANVTEHKND